jgi:hypothetical protein
MASASDRAEKSAATEDDTGSSTDGVATNAEAAVEMEAWPPENIAAQELEMLTGAFSDADTDKSGVLEVAELEALLEKLDVAPSDAAMRLTMDRYDKDHSGTLGLKEFVAIFAHLKETDGQADTPAEKALFGMYVDGMIDRAMNAISPVGGSAAPTRTPAGISADDDSGCNLCGVLSEPMSDADTGADTSADTGADTAGADVAVAPVQGSDTVGGVAAAPSAAHHGRLAHGHAREAPRHQDADNITLPEACLVS